MKIIIGLISVGMCVLFVAGVIKNAQSKQRKDDFPWDDLG